MKRKQQSIQINVAHTKQHFAGERGGQGEGGGEGRGEGERMACIPRDAARDITELDAATLSTARGHSFLKSASQTHV